MNHPKLRWVGIGITVLICLFFSFNVLVKLFPQVFYPKMIEQMAEIGLSEKILTPVACLEALCVIVYAIPATSVLGAILFTGYLGGAILAHLRVEQPVVVQTVFGVIVWAGIYLREPRLREILPSRKK